MLPKRRKARKAGIREEVQIRCPGHLAWVRGHECLALDETCSDRIEAAHVRVGTDGGMGVKPSDCFTVPLCSNHHRIQHDMGEGAFENRFGVKMRKSADELWLKSPHRQKHLARSPAEIPEGAKSVERR